MVGVAIRGWTGELVVFYFVARSLLGSDRGLPVRVIAWMSILTCSSLELFRYFKEGFASFERELEL